MDTFVCTGTSDKGGLLGINGIRLGDRTRCYERSEKVAFDSVLGRGPTMISATGILRSAVGVDQQLHPFVTTPRVPNQDRDLLLRSPLVLGNLFFGELSRIYR